MWFNWLFYVVYISSVLVRTAQLLELLRVVGEICKHLNAGCLLINQRGKAHGVFDIRQLAAAHAELDNVDELILDAALLEPALGLLCIKALALTKNLYIHNFASYASQSFAGHSRRKKMKIPLNLHACEHSERVAAGCKPLG